MFGLSNRSVLCSVDVVRWMVERFVVFLRGGVDRAQKQTSTLSGVKKYLLTSCAMECTELVQVWMASNRLRIWLGTARRHQLLTRDDISLSAAGILLNAKSCHRVICGKFDADFYCFLLWPPYGIGQAIIFCAVVSIFLSFFLSIFFPRQISAVGDWTSMHTSTLCVALVRI